MSRRRTLVDHVCPGCGKPYRPHSSSQVYCSRACRFVKHHPTMAPERGPILTLREEIEAARREAPTAPLYRHWWRHHA